MMGTFKVKTKENIHPYSMRRFWLHSTYITEELSTKGVP